MRTLRQILGMGGTQREIVRGVWVAARPEPGPLSWRMRDAWEVFRGRADAFTWPDTRPETWCSIPAAPREEEQSNGR